LWALPHGEENESTSLKNSFWPLSGSFETSTPGTGVVSMVLGSFLCSALSAALMAPVSVAAFDFSQEAPARKIAAGASNAGVKRCGNRTVSGNRRTTQVLVQGVGGCKTRHVDVARQTVYP